MTMRQWISAIALLVVVACVATFAVGSIIAVIEATNVLQRTVVGVDDSLYAGGMSECDPLELDPCF
jgi:hypothetical protein